MPSGLHQWWRWWGQFQFLHVSSWHTSPAPQSLQEQIYFYRPVTERNTSEGNCRHLIRAPVSRKRGIQREWNWLRSSSCSRRISAMPRREGVTAQTTDLPRFALAQTALSESSSLALCTDEGDAEYREEERTYYKGNGNWSPSGPLLPFTCSRLSLPWCLPCFFPSCSPLHFNIRT